MADENGAEAYSISAPKALWALVNEVSEKEVRDRSNVVQIALVEYLAQHHPNIHRKLTGARPQR